MALSNPTPNLALEQQVDGANDDTWGDRLNANIVRIEAAITGTVQVDVTSGQVTLSEADSSDLAGDATARYLVIEAIGSPTAQATVFLPVVPSKVYILRNDTGQVVSFNSLSNGQGYIQVQPGSQALGYNRDGTFGHAVNQVGALATDNPPPAADRSNRLATTNWVGEQFPAQLAATGYATQPNGLLENWGVAVSSSGGPITATFTKAFGTVCFGVVVTVISGGNPSPASATVSGVSQTEFQFEVVNASGTAIATQVFYRAIGV